MHLNPSQQQAAAACMQRLPPGTFLKTELGGASNPLFLWANAHSVATYPHSRQHMFGNQEVR